MQEVHITLAITGAFITILGFVAYNAKEDKISSATWLMWVIGDSLEAASYFAMTGEDFLKNAVPITFACGSLITFVIALTRKRFGLPDPVDWAIVAVDGVITLGWWQKTLTAFGANLSLVATEVVSFIPLYRGVLKGTEREYPAAWILWALGDVAFLAVVLMLPHTGKELIYPIVQMILHLLVVLCIGVALKKHTKRVPL